MSQYFSRPSSHKENIKLRLPFLVMQQKKILMILLVQILQTLH